MLIAVIGLWLLIYHLYNHICKLKHSLKKVVVFKLITAIGPIMEIASDRGNTFSIVARYSYHFKKNLHLTLDKTDEVIDQQRM